jgi:hypothetical protein
VAEAVAAHLGISKAELLDPGAPDMAVRQALGETQVVAATKSALGDAGGRSAGGGCAALAMSSRAQECHVSRKAPAAGQGSALELNADAHTFLLPRHLLYITSPRSQSGVRIISG